MRIPLLLIVLALLFSPAVVAQTTNDNQTDDEIAEAVPEEGSYVRLYTGEVVEGELSLRMARGVPEYVVVNDTRYPHFQVHSYRMDGEVYGFANIGLPQPMLVRQQIEGQATVYREATRDGRGADYFRIGNEPIRIASGTNLRQAFAGHDEAMRYLQRDRMLGYAGIGGFVIGAGLVLTGAAVQFGDLDAPFSGVIIAGSGVAIAVAINTLVPGARQHARRAAIDAFNQ